MPSGIE